MNCPVCNTPDVNTDAAECPQCKSDLEIFRLLSDAGKQHQVQKRLTGLLGILFAVAVVGWASAKISSSGKTDISDNATASAVSEETNAAAEENNTEFLALKNENEALKSEIRTLNEKITSLNQEISSFKTNASEGGAIIHIVQKGESLWKIAVKYFGDGYKFSKIAKDNGLKEESLLHEGIKLKIIK